MYTVYENYVLIIGRGWYSQPAQQRINLTRFDTDNIKEIIDSGIEPRQAVESWIDTHSGDFQHIEDFYALLDNLKIELPFSKEESEVSFYDTELD